MQSAKTKFLTRCAMTAIVAASAAFAGDAGGPAPAFTLSQLDGSQGALAQYKGQVVMVNFWATWCGPCQQEMPLLDQMYKKYKPAGFTLIGVNVDKEAPPVKALRPSLFVPGAAIHWTAVNFWSARTCAYVSHSFASDSRAPSHAVSASQKNGR